MRAGLRLLQEEEAESRAVRDRLETALGQMRDGDLAEGTGAEAVHRAFAGAKRGQ